MNSTTEHLLAYAEHLALENLRKDAGYQKLFCEWEALAKSFRSRHGRNRPLMDEMNRLQDARSAVLFSEADFLFFLGLQMGLELGRIDLFQDGWQH